jgi:predicted alpha/beta-hydrolase family hydrolase
MTISIDKADSPVASFIFAHGAGANKDSEFMQAVTENLVRQRINVVRFNFEYMQKAIALNKRYPPDRIDKLCLYYHQIVSEVSDTLPIFIGGKSMGGRVSTMILEQSKAKAAICFGYPFHPPGKLDKLRVDHLQELSKPLLVLQGERDTFGSQTEVSLYSLSKMVKCCFLADGDHSLKPRKSSGLTQADNINKATDMAAKFIKDSL